MAKKDNSTVQDKTAIRIAALKDVPEPRIVETNGGNGVLFLRCYSRFAQGVVFEKDAEKCNTLARQRPGWSVYEGDCVAALAAGIGYHHEPNYFDIDPYGSCWPIIEGIMSGMSHRPDTFVLVVNCGLRQKLRLKGGWTVHCLREMTEKYGNESLNENYLPICRELMTEKARAIGYTLASWHGYYCGSKKDMTHFKTVLARQ